MIKKFSVLMLLALLFIPIIFGAAVERVEAQTNNRAAVNCRVYSITLRGTAGGRAFVRSGVLVITSTLTRTGVTNGVNPIDFWIGSGRPWITPSTGAILFATNTAFFTRSNYGRAQLDIVRFATSNGWRYVYPDTNFVGPGSHPNAFNVGSSITSQANTIFSGAMRLALTNRGRNVSGAINVNSFQYTSARYIATFSGRYVGTTTACGASI